MIILVVMHLLLKIFERFNFSCCFQHPEVTDIVYPTSWVDELPFLTAPEVQTAWPVTNNVNLLASGRHSPQSLGQWEIFLLKIILSNSKSKSCHSSKSLLT